MEIEQVRAALGARRGEWSKIAQSAGINRKTLWRIAADPQYNPTLRTMRALSVALGRPGGPVAERMVKEAA